MMIEKYRKYCIEISISGIRICGSYVKMKLYSFFSVHDIWSNLEEIVFVYYRNVVHVKEINIQTPLRRSVYPDRNIHLRAFTVIILSWRFDV
jgi:hypothetical protein